MRTKNRWRTLLIALTLLICTISVGWATGTADTGVDETGSAVPSLANAGGPFTPYDPPITIEMVRATNPVEEGNVNTLKSITGETIEDNRWTRAFFEELGINIEYRWIVNAEQFAQKWRVAMAIGDIPDVARASLADLGQLTEAGIIHEMGDVWEQFASPLTRDIATTDGDAVFRASTIDGNLMGIPEVIAALDSYQYLWMRTDWMEDLGLEEPETMDELLTIMEAFVEQDPDGNGERDTYAMIVNKDLWSRLEGFFWCFEAYPDSWIEGDDGSLVFGGTQPEMKTPLRHLQEMYSNGWLDREFVVKNDFKATEAVAAGKCGIVVGYHWDATMLMQSRINDPNADWGCFEWPGVDGRTVVGELELGLGDVLVVNEEFEHPEAVVKMLNLYYEKLYGETGDPNHWANAEVPDIWALGPLQSFHPESNILAYNEVQQVLKGQMEPEELTWGKNFYTYYLLDDYRWLAERIVGLGEYTSCYHMNRVAEDRSLVFTDGFVGAPTPTMIERMGPLNELTNTTMVKIITGELDVDSGFDQYVEDWNRLGGAEITREVNAWRRSN